MNQTNFFDKDRSINLTNKTSDEKVDTAAEESPKLQMTDNDLCRDLMMMCMFSTYYSGFYPDMSMFR